MKRNIYVVNGPNLNLLGKRQPEIYGKSTLEDVAANCRKLAKKLGVSVDFFQSNHEGEIIETIHDARTKAGGIIINAGGFSHSSIAILDALNAFEGKVVEVHVSNVLKRESFRHNSYIATRADGVIVGLGIKGYEFAVEYLAGYLK